MKKYFISAAVVAAMGAGSIYGYRTMNPNDVLSDAQLANIEALSRSEVGEACGGCSTSYTGPHCCWALFISYIDPETNTAYGTLVEFFEPKTLF